jgi:hypothetical protein
MLSVRADRLVVEQVEATSDDWREGMLGILGMLKTRCWVETKELHLSSSMLPREIARGSPKFGVFDQLDALPKKVGLFCEIQSFAA